jgi:ribosomal protein L32
MAEVNLKKCPNCGVHAIRIEPDMAPEELVECNNCHDEFKLKEIVKKP